MNKIRFSFRVWLFSIIMTCVFTTSQSQNTVKKDSTSYEHMLLFSSFNNDHVGLSTNYTMVKKFKVSDLPLFCKIEHLIESKSKIAFRFRLGELNYVNYLENKR